MRIGLNWRSVLEGGGPLGVAIAKELDNLIAGIDAWSIVEHNDDGTHRDVTATSVTITQLTGTALSVVSGLSMFAGAFALPGLITPDEITSNQNDYAPSGYDTAFCLRLSSDASRTITGIVATTPAAGRILFLVNVGADDITLAHENTASTAENRFLLAGSTDVTLTTLSTILLYYDAVSERWISLGGTGSGGSIPPHNLLSVTHPDTTPDSPVQGDVIRADRTVSGAVDALKYWANGSSFRGLSGGNDPGNLSYWFDGVSGFELPPSISLGTVTWKRKGVGSVGQVLTTVLDQGQLVPDWQDAAGGGDGTAVGAVAYATAVQSLPWNAPTAISFAATELDTSGFWTATVPTRLTITTTGLYVVIGQVGFAPFLGARVAQVRVNGVVRASQEIGELDGDTLANLSVMPVQCSRLLSLTAGDYVELYAQQLKTTVVAVNTVAGSANTFLSITRV